MSIIKHPRVQAAQLKRQADIRMAAEPVRKKAALEKDLRLLDCVMQGIRQNLEFPKRVSPTKPFWHEMNMTKRDKVGTL